MVSSWRRPTTRRRNPSFLVVVVFAIMIASSHSAINTSLSSRIPIHNYFGDPAQLPLGMCKGECQSHGDCQIGLFCYPRKPYQSVPGCSGGEQDATVTKYCVKASPNKIVNYGNYSDQRPLLGQCQGHCYGDDQCLPGHYCFQREPFQAVPGCIGGETYNNTADFCVVAPPGKLIYFGGDPSELRFPLQECEGDCDSNSDCDEGLVCFQRNEYEAVPGCLDGDLEDTKTDYCILASPTSAPSFLPVPTNGTTADDLLPSQGLNASLLGACQGNCRMDDNCLPGHYCFKREPFQAVPGCDGGESYPNDDTQFCVIAPPGKLIYYEGTPSELRYPLQECEGDCDDDSDCDEGLVCFQRNEYQSVPGCLDGDLENTKTDYCVSSGPTPAPYFLPVPPKDTITYYPGNLTTYKDDLLMSEGLDSKLLAISWQNVTYANGETSTIPFHGSPDAGDTFPDFREFNLGGWVYVSNSEMKEAGTGGVGALTFDKGGNLIDYRMVLENSTWNCGGGSTPWNTWVSCEEYKEGGVVYQVDPFGERPSEVMTMGSSKGKWESFAYDIRDQSLPRFFITEDDAKGAMERYTPTNPHWNNVWDMLHGNGTIDYLLIFPNNVNATSGTFAWTHDRSLAQSNAKQFYPNTEGIDVHGNELYFVCKKIQMLYILNLDEGTYIRTSTRSGLFNSEPDQLQQILGESSGLLYFTEDGGSYAGIHARDKNSRFYTIMESPTIPGETTGLAFSPDGMFMYVAYQRPGQLYALWRRDGLPFQSTRLDVKYHEANTG